MMTADFYAQPHIKNILQTLENSRKNGKTIVLATGFFDLLHEEHKKFLLKARQAGDVLVVGVESDVRVKKIKGEGRPIHTQKVRLQQIKDLSYVNEVFVLPDEFSLPQDHEQLIAHIRPNILAISSHSDHQDKKRALVEKYGGELRIVHQHNPQVSTSQLLSGVQ